MRRGWAYRVLNEVDVATLAVPYCSIGPRSYAALNNWEVRRIVLFDTQAEEILKATPTRSCVVLVCDESDEASPDSKLHSQTRRVGAAPSIADSGNR